MHALLNQSVYNFNCQTNSGWYCKCCHGKTTVINDGIVKQR